MYIDNCEVYPLARNQRTAADARQAGCGANYNTLLSEVPIVNWVLSDRISKPPICGVQSTPATIVAFFPRKRSEP
jgi:hypothetical protein